MTSWFDRRPLVLFVAAYLAIGALAAAAWQVLPGSLRAAVDSLTGGAGLGAVGTAFGRAPIEALPRAPMWAIAAVAMTCAGVLALPVAWLYTITRQKRGYRQSVVHSLVLLPVVVAGVVVLVKFSLALAFSLAGIVAAVRFRNTLEDSKDAVFIFVATGVGLACGVELSAALTLSALFNIATLLLFYSDFGRSPGRLEGELAEERMRRALAVANRTSQFVARLDREILEQMAPEQLEALADRAWRRRKEVAGEPTSDSPRFDSVLTAVTDGSQLVRESVEALIGQNAKRWRFLRREQNGDSVLLAYELKLRKSVQPTAFLDALKAAAGSGLRNLELK